MRITLNNSTFKIPNPFSTQYKLYFYYLIFSLFSGIYGIMLGKYHITTLSFTESFTVTVFRPIIEYVIAFYYFAYFVILPRYLIKTNKEINYFFKIFSTCFFFSLFIGLIDLGIMLMFKGYEGIPRHIADLRVVGFRFHGIAGEPRDAFVYLLLGLCIFKLQEIWTGVRNLSNFKIFLILVALLLTQSASGLIGLLFASIFIAIFYIPKAPSFHLNILLILFIFIIVIGSTYVSPRLLQYAQAFSELYTTLDSGKEVESILSVSMNNIYPVWSRRTEIKDFNILPLLFGTGLGSASVLNNIYFESNEIHNPNANIVRSIYATGIIGTSILFSAFIYPFQKFVPREVRFKIILLMLFLLGAYFSHRHIAPFIFLGAVLIVIRNKYYSIEKYAH